MRKRERKLKRLYRKRCNKSGKDREKKRKENEKERKKEIHTDRVNSCYDKLYLISFA